MVETRRSSSSSKRPLPSPPSAVFNGKRSKAADVVPSTDRGLSVPPAETQVPATESDLEHRGHEAVPSDPSGATLAKAPNGTTNEKDPGGQVEGVDSLIDAVKSKSNVTSSNKGKKRQLKSNVGIAWGKLLSQSLQQSRQVVRREYLECQ